MLIQINTNIAATALTNGNMGKNVIILGVNASSSAHSDSEKKDILIFGKSATQELDDTTLTAEAEYLINYSRSNKKFCLSLHYNGSNSFLLVNATKIYQFKANDSEMKKYPLRLGKVSKDFTVINRIKWTCLRILC